MKKKISNSLFLLALCMQYGAGKVEALDSTIAEAHISKKEQSDVTGSLLILNGKIPGYKFSHKQLDSIYDSLEDLYDVLENQKEKNYKSKQTIEDKKRYVQATIAELVDAFCGKKLDAQNMKKASKLIGDMENTLSGTSSKKVLRSKK